MTNAYPSALAAALVLGGVPAAVATAQPPASDPAPPAGQPPGTVPAPGGESAPSGAEPLAPETPVAPEDPDTAGDSLDVSYDGGVKLATVDGKFSAKLGVRSQVRLESTRPTDAGAEFENRLFIARARIGLEGNVFGSANHYKIETALGDRGSFGYVKDLWIERSSGPVRIRFGQWKRPFNRQELVSDFAGQFNERANTAEFVGGGRDAGVAIHNGYEESPEGVEWALGVFNRFSGGSDRPVITTSCTQDGTAIRCMTPAPTTVPDDWGPALVARLGWNSTTFKGYSEGDLEGGPPRYAVAASYKIDLANFSRGGQASKADNVSHGFEVDAMIKVEGLSLELGAYLMKLKAAGAALGALVQAGMLVIPKHGEIAARFAIAPTTGDRDQIEARGAFNWYWQGHRWKWATDLGLVQETGSDPVTLESGHPEYQLRTTVQLVF